MFRRIGVLRSKATSIPQKNQEQEHEVSGSQRQYLARLVIPVSDQPAKLIEGIGLSEVVDIKSDRAMCCHRVVANTNKV